MAFAELWFLATLLGTFVVLTARLGLRLTFVELVAASVAVGCTVPAWIVYIVACLTSAIG